MTELINMGLKQLKAALEGLQGPNVRALVECYTPDYMAEVLSSICAGKLLLHISPWIDSIYNMYSSGDIPSISSFVSAYSEYIKCRIDNIETKVYMSTISANIKAQAMVAHILLCEKEDLPLWVNSGSIVTKPIVIWRLSKNI